MAVETLDLISRVFLNKERGAYTLSPLIPREVVQTRIKELAQQITTDYKGQKLMLVASLKGANAFLVDLMREIDNNDLEIEFVQISSYGDGTTSQDLKVKRDFDADTLNGSHVLIVEDIADTRKTLKKLLQNASALNVSSIRVATLLSKPSRKQEDVFLDYVGFEIPDLFVVGEGLDYQQKHRHLQGIYVVNFL